jgi:hypothetical protein
MRLGLQAAACQGNEEAEAHGRWSLRWRVASAGETVSDKETWVWRHVRRSVYDRIEGCAWWSFLHGCWVARLGDPLRGGERRSHLGADERGREAAGGTAAGVAFRSDSCVEEL